MFKSFNTKFPEYEVITPQTKLSFTLRSMTVQEEERLKASLVTPAKVLEHLNSCIYDCIVKKPAEIKDFISFQKNITVKDRDALLYGLYHITYEEVRNYEVICSTCSAKNQVTIKATDTFNITPYPDEDILTKSIRLALPSTVNVTAFIKQPTLEEEQKMIKELNGNDAATESLVIEKFEQDIPNSKESIVYSNRSDIYMGYLDLLPRDRKAIYASYIENFGKYGIELKMKVNCVKCGTSDSVNIDLVDSFFRNAIGG